MTIDSSFNLNDVVKLMESRFGLGRIGISLYGVWPSQWTQRTISQMYSDAVDLQPVLSWKTTISTIKKISVGDYVGYDCTYRADKDMTIAVLPVEYAGGFPRLVGEVIDVDHVKNVAYGDTVTLIGNDG